MLGASDNKHITESYSDAYYS